MKHLCEVKAGARFIYGGIEWVKLETPDAGTLALSAEPVFERAFDEENCNDWRKSSLRRELNGTFLDALEKEGADRAAFMEFDSDLTADDGMKNYGCATDRIALLSCDMYRKFRDLIPRVEDWCWTLTPWTCDPEYSYYVHNVTSSGALDISIAYSGYYGVRPLCYLKSEILVSIPGEEGKDSHTAEDLEEVAKDACDAILEALNEYPAEAWGTALGLAVTSLFQSKQDADAIKQDSETAAEG